MFEDVIDVWKVVLSGKMKKHFWTNENNYVHRARVRECSEVSCIKAAPNMSQLQLGGLGDLLNYKES